MIEIHCGGIFDMFIDYADDAKELSAIIHDKYGYKLDNCVTSFHGICLDCVEIS